MADKIAALAVEAGCAQEVIDILLRGDGSVVPATDPLRTGKEGLLCGAKEPTGCLDPTCITKDGELSELDRTEREKWTAFLKRQRERKQKKECEQQGEYCREK